jgi:hypothetical protein
MKIQLPREQEALMNGKVTVNKPGTQMQGQPVSVSGTAPPGAGVSVTQGDGQHQHATAGPDGRWGATLIAPDPGPQTISVSSTDATTTTTYTVRPRPRP